MATRVRKASTTPRKASTAKKAPPARKPRAAKRPVKAQPPQEEKARKPKLVRDSFTIPKTEYAAIDALKKRAAAAHLPSKKSEVLRAGVMALAAMDDAAFRAAVGAVPTLKTGRPKKK